MRVPLMNPNTLSDRDMPSGKNDITATGDRPSPIRGRSQPGADVEELTHAYGREIFERLGSERHFPFHPAWWDDRLMEWTMGDEAVKVELFRFIDVLPLLNSGSAIS